MQKRIIFFTVFISTVFFVSAENIEVKILLKTAETGDLHVLLTDIKTFKEPFAGIAGNVIAIGEAHIAAGHTDFVFKNIQPGIYGIRCFLDTDGNGKLNRGLFGPTEPWGMSWNKDKQPGLPTFEHIAFELGYWTKIINISVE